MHRMRTLLECVGCQVDVNFIGLTHCDCQKSHSNLMTSVLDQKIICRDPFNEMGDSLRSDDDSVEEVPLTAGNFRRPVSRPKHWGNLLLHNNNYYRIFISGVEKNQHICLGVNITILYDACTPRTSICSVLCLRVLWVLPHGRQQPEGLLEHCRLWQSLSLQHRQVPIAVRHTM